MPSIGFVSPEIGFRIVECCENKKKPVLAYEVLIGKYLHIISYLERYNVTICMDYEITAPGPPY